MTLKKPFSILQIKPSPKTQINTNLKRLQEETILNLKNSKADNTVRAYKSDFNDFGVFCSQNGFKSLPSEPKIVSLYLTYLSSKDVKMSRVKLNLAKIIEQKPRR